MSEEEEREKGKGRKRRILGPGKHSKRQSLQPTRIRIQEASAVQDPTPYLVGRPFDSGPNPSMTYSTPTHKMTSLPDVPTIEPSQLAPLVKKSLFKDSLLVDQIWEKLDTVSQVFDITDCFLFFIFRVPTWIVLYVFSL